MAAAEAMNKAAAETADFERDPNQGSMMITDLKPEDQKERQYLMSELSDIKH